MTGDQGDPVRRASGLAGAIWGQRSGGREVRTGGAPSSWSIREDQGEHWSESNVTGRLGWSARMRSQTAQSLFAAPDSVLTAAPGSAAAG
jgi:hypothetical protein